MTILDLVRDNEDYGEGDAILSSPSVDWDFTKPQEEAMQFATDLIETMYHHNGLGLAAVQTRHLWRVFVMRGTTENGDFACFNPRIVTASEEKILLDESCLSYPGVVVKIKRPRHVKLRFVVPSGEVVTQQFTGMTARVVQHEMDHLDGVLFFNRANKYHRDQGFRNRKKYEVVEQSKINFLGVSPFDFL